MILTFAAFQLDICHWQYSKWHGCPISNLAGGRITVSILSIIIFWKLWCQLLKSRQKKNWKMRASSKLSAYSKNYMHRTEWWWVLKRKYTYFIALLFAFLFVFEGTLFEQLTFTHHYCLSTHKQTFNFVSFQSYPHLPSKENNLCLIFITAIHSLSCCSSELFACS